MIRYCIIPPQGDSYVAILGKSQGRSEFLANIVGENYQEITTVGQFPVVGSYLYVNLKSRELPNYIASALSGRPITGTAVVFGGKEGGRDVEPNLELTSRILNDKAFCKTYVNIEKIIHENY